MPTEHVHWTCGCSAKGTALATFNAHSKTCPMERFTLRRWQEVSTPISTPEEPVNATPAS